MTVARGGVNVIGKKPAVKKSAKSRKTAPRKDLSLEEKIADVAGRVNRIAEGDDPRYHLR
jgi:hypothetical protein